MSYKVKNSVNIKINKLFSTTNYFYLLELEFLCWKLVQRQKRNKKKVKNKEKHFFIFADFAIHARTFGQARLWENYVDHECLWNQHF